MKISLIHYDKTYSVEVDCEEINVYEVFELFHSLLRISGFSEDSIKEAREHNEESTVSAVTGYRKEKK